MQIYGPRAAKVNNFLFLQFFLKVHKYVIHFNEDYYDTDKMNNFGFKLNKGFFQVKYKHFK